MPTDFRLDPKNWDDENQLIIGTKTARRDNLTIAKLNIDLHDIVQSHYALFQTKLSADRLREVFVKGLKKQAGIIDEVDDRPKIVDFFPVVAEHKSEGTKIQYRQTLARLREYDPEFDSKTFEDIDYNYLQLFIKNRLGKLKHNSVVNYVSRLAAVFNYAIDEGITNNYPFRKIKMNKEICPFKHISAEDIVKFMNFKGWRCLERHRDYALLSFYLIGINTKDLFLLDKIENGRIEYNRCKTGRHYSIKVEPEAMELIKKYRGKTHLVDAYEFYTGSHSSIVGNMDDRLKTIAKEIGANESVTVYHFRRAWATIASRLDIPKDVIAKALGHGMQTVTDCYIDFDIRKVDEANRKVIDYVLSLRTNESKTDDLGQSVDS